MRETLARDRPSHYGNPGVFCLHDYWGDRRMARDRPSPYGEGGGVFCAFVNAGVFSVSKKNLDKKTTLLLK